MGGELRCFGQAVRADVHDDLDAGRRTDDGPAVVESRTFRGGERTAFTGSAADEDGRDAVATKKGGLLLDDGEVHRPVGMERRVGGRAEASELEGGHGQEVVLSRGRMQSAMKMESKAMPAKTPKMRFSGMCRSRKTPKIQSAKPPQLMLTKFIRP